MNQIPNIEEGSEFEPWLKMYLIQFASDEEILGKAYQDITKHHHQQLQKAQQEVVAKWRKSIDDEARSCTVKIEEAVQKAREEEYERGWADGAAGVITEHKFMSVDDAEKMLREKGYKHLADALHHSELDQPNK